STKDLNPMRRSRVSFMGQLPPHAFQPGRECAACASSGQVIRIAFAGRMNREGPKGNKAGRFSSVFRGEGNDGNGGSDTLWGGEGNDWFDGARGSADRIDGGPGVGTPYYF